MKKIAISLLVLSLFTGLVSAEVYVGDTVDFFATVDPGICGLTCDQNISDGSGMWLYGGYALKNPSGDIVAQGDPVEHCGVGCTGPPGLGCEFPEFQTEELCPVECIWTGDTFSPSISYTVDEPGTWTFCAGMFALGIVYEDMCQGDIVDCPMTQCMTVEVGTCDENVLQSLVDDAYNGWLFGW